MIIRDLSKSGADTERQKMTHFRKSTDTPTDTRLVVPKRRFRER